MDRHTCHEPVTKHPTQTASTADSACIEVFGAREHNLRNINVRIPRTGMTVITGVSGSGKSSLAFDTLYAEGQRRYVESLSAGARQFLEQLPRPDVDRIEGLCPTLAIEQRSANAGRRSTVATVTDVYDFLRVLFARVGAPSCWICGRPIARQSTAEIVDAVLAERIGKRIMILAPVIHDQAGDHAEWLGSMIKQGFVRARIDGQVSMIEEHPTLRADRRHTVEIVVDRLAVKPDVASRLADSIETAGNLSGGRILLSIEIESNQWTDQPFSTTLCCPVHAEVRLDELSPALFSFNTPLGACDICHGLGRSTSFDPDLVVPQWGRSLRDGAIVALRGRSRTEREEFDRLVTSFCTTFDVRPDIPFREIPPALRDILMHGTNAPSIRKKQSSFEGVLPILQRRWESDRTESRKQQLQAFLSEAPCEQCRGARLNQRALSVRVQEKSIADFTRMNVDEALCAMDALRWSTTESAVAEPLVREIRHRLRFLHEVGVSYLTLDRAAPTLSGGEWQRIRLAAQIGGGLSGVCYILDEPTIGLHPRDSKRLTETIQRLARMGNTFIVVEHDEEVIAGSDHLLEIGPGAGPHGGRVTAEGPIRQVMTDPACLTAKYLTGERTIPVPAKRRPIDASRCIEVRGARANNLKNINVRIPVERFVCVTGVSGSGKSTLIGQVLVRALRRMLHGAGPTPDSFDQLLGAELIDGVVEVDQSPLGRNSRGNAASCVGAIGPIRELFAKTREARVRGYGPNRFSFNVDGGRCRHCRGQGTRRVPMHFLPDVFVTCASCGGKRFNRETLEIRYRGKSIADVLDMRIEEAVEFFSNFSNILARLTPLHDVGLGYLSLGQSANTFSGGEAQRIKLAAELHRGKHRATLSNSTRARNQPLDPGAADDYPFVPRSDTNSRNSGSLYVLDEPTTGLHFADVENLLKVLHRLVDRGNSLIVIEHHLDVIRSADWIIDLGPEAGDNGGRLVAEGAPEDVARIEESRTGQHLRNRFPRRT